jgi:urease accessory protein UreE
MATFAIKIVLLIAALVLANAFRSVKLGNRALSLGRRHAASTMTDEEVVAAYDKIFEKVRDAT